MVCKAVTITPSQAQISLFDWEVIPGDNKADVSYTLENSGDIEGSATVSITVDVGENGSIDASEEFSQTVASGDTVQNSVTFQFNLSDDTTTRICIEVN